MTLKNEALYEHLFNLRDMVNSMMSFDDCWSLQYAVKNNVITHINAHMDQLYEQDYLSPVNAILEDLETVKKKPDLKEVLNVKNQVYTISKFIGNTELKEVSITLNNLIGLIEKEYM
jgi:hypothetical protein